MTPPRFEFRPLPPQDPFLFPASGTSWVALVGGVGSGKTTAGSVWALRRIIENPETVGLIAANTYRQLSQSTLPPFLVVLAKCNFEQGRDYVVNVSPSWYRSRFPKPDGVLSFKSGAQVLLRSLEKFQVLRGVEIGWAWLDETRDTRVEAFDVVLARLRHALSQRLEGRITTTPDGFDWLYERFVDPGTPGYAVVHAQTASNPYLPSAYVQSLRDAYDPELAKQEMEGAFIAVGRGRVYQQFDRAQHVGGGTEYRPSDELMLCCDFNVNPMCWVIVQERAGVTIVVDEMVLRNATTQMAADAFAARYAQHRAGVTIYGDAAGRSRSTKSHQSDYQILESVLRQHFAAVNSCVRPANPSVVDRVNAVNARLRNVAGAVRLRINPACKVLARDLDMVVWAEGQGRMLDKRDRELTHASDALGYYIAERWPVVRKLKVI